MKNGDATILVVGATGTVGGAALCSLIARGVRVRCLARSEASGRQLEATGAEVVLGDLGDGDAIARSLLGVRAALYVSPHAPDEESIAERFLAHCERRSVRLVFVGVHIDGATRIVRAVRRLLFGLWLPHYAPKFRIAERARRSKASPIVLMPTNFFQNDDLFREDLLAGVFRQPFARPINRVDARDIGAAAARACIDASLPSGAYPVVGPASLDAVACARTWSDALGYPVTYEENDDLLRASLARRIEGKKLEDFSASYAAIKKITLPTPERELAQTMALLGRPPTPYADFVRERASQWCRTGEQGRDAINERHQRASRSRCSRH